MAILSDGEEVRHLCPCQPLGDTDKLLRLPLLLKDSAIAVYERHASAETYQNLVDAMKRSFSPDTEEARRLAHRQLQDRRLQVGGDLEVYLRALERLVDRAAPGLPADLRNRQLSDHFVESLPPSLADQLYVLAPKTLEDTVTRARELTVLEQRRGIRARKLAGITACEDEWESDERRGGVMLRAMQALTDRLEKLEVQTARQVEGSWGRSRHFVVGTMSGLWLWRVLPSAVRVPE